MNLESSKSPLRRIEEISDREFRLVVWVFLVLAALGALYFAFRTGYLAGSDEAVSGRVAPKHHDYSFDLMRLKIGLAMFVIVLGLWIKRVLGFFVSVLATLFIIYQYAGWYVDSKRWLREMGVRDFSQLPVPSEWGNFAGFYQATPWDIVVLACTSLLLVWQVRVIIALVPRGRRLNMPPSGG